MSQPEAISINAKNPNTEVVPMAQRRKYPREYKERIRALENITISLSIHARTGFQCSAIAVPALFNWNIIHWRYLSPDAVC